MLEKSVRIYLLPVICITVFIFLSSAVCSAQNQRNTGGNTADAKAENRKKNVLPKQAASKPEYSPQNLPLDRLPPEIRSYVKSFRQQYTLYREMPRLGFDCDKEMFCFLKEHPDLVIGFWEAFGATEISLKEVRENRYRMTESSGTTANIRILYQTPEISIVYAKGEFRSPMLVREIAGETLLILYSQFTEGKNGNPSVVCRLETFIRIENGGADFLARLFSSVLGKIADSNYEQTLTFVSKLSSAAGTSPHNVKGVLQQVKNVRYEVIENFCNTVDNVFERTEIRKEHFIEEHLLKEHFFTEHAESASQVNEEPLLSEPFFWEKQIEKQILERQVPEKQSYVIPSPPFGKIYSFSEQPADKQPAEETEKAEQKENYTAADSDAGKQEASKPKGGAVFGKPKL